MPIERFKLEKLVRDKALERLAGPCSHIETRILSDQEFLHELKRKLVEEAHEVAESNTKEELIAELADVLEVIHTLCAFNDICMSEVTKEQEAKRQTRGSFSKRIYVKYMDAPHDGPLAEYARKAPHKYPRIPLNEEE